MIAPRSRPLLCGSLLLAAAMVLVSAFASANTVPASNAGVHTESVLLDSMIPPECAFIVFDGISAGDGTGGNDLIIGTPGNDVIRSKGGTDCILGGAGDDNITGTGGLDVILGGAGKDIIDGKGGNDHLYGGDGNDTLIGGGGTDQCHGGADTDSGSSCESTTGIP